jgi:ParB-like chromosome segregation protein Spo0J
VTAYRKLQIQHVPPASLKSHPRNPRKIGAEEKAALRRGIEAFGLVEPFVARREDSIMLGGHQRLAIATELGYETVPVVFLDGLSDAEVDTLLVLLNNPKAQGSWDLPKLTGILSDLDAEGFDATLTGFDEKALESLLASDALSMVNKTGDEGEQASAEKLAWGEEKVPMTAAEVETLTERLAAYRHRVGTDYGFVADLLGAATARET